MIAKLAGCPLNNILSMKKQWQTVMFVVLRLPHVLQSHWVRIIMYSLVRTINVTSVWCKKSKVSSYYVKWTETGYRKQDNESLFEMQNIVCTHPSTINHCKQLLLINTSLASETLLMGTVRTKQACNSVMLPLPLSEVAPSKEGNVLPLIPLSLSLRTQRTFLFGWFISPCSLLHKSVYLESL